MMATVRGNLLQELTGEEVSGVMDSMTRLFLVEGLGSTSSSAIAEALQSSGIPPYGEIHASYPNLYVARRSARIDENSPDKAYVTCVYESVARDRFSNIAGQFRVSGGTALTQRRTSYDALGNQLFVEHTFPVDDPDYPGMTIQQGAEADVLMPQTTIVLEGLLYSAVPHYISRSMVGHINLAYWAGGGPGTWLCTGGNFGLNQAPNLFAESDQQLPQWAFTVELLFDPEGHVPFVQYLDQRVNRPAPNLVYGQGIKPVQWYPYFDFNALVTV
jgi:hypothetical protein